MSEYLISLNIPIERIKIDNLGNTTRLTMINFKSSHPHYTAAYVVSQYYHISRAKLALNQEGIKAVYGAYAEYFE